MIRRTANWRRLNLIPDGLPHGLACDHGHRQGEIDAARAFGHRNGQARVRRFMYIFRHTGALAAEQQDVAVSEIVRCNAEVADALTLRHMLAAARAIVVSALGRTESRGAHVRSDFPERDDAAPVRNMVVKMSDGRCELRRVATGE